jgi:hypothetical protein
MSTVETIATRKADVLARQGQKMSKWISNLECGKMIAGNAEMAASPELTKEIIRKAKVAIPGQSRVSEMTVSVVAGYTVDDEELPDISLDVMKVASTKQPRYFRTSQTRRGWSLTVGYFFIALAS